MRRSDLIWALTDVDEELVQAAKEETMKKRKLRPLRVALIGAAAVALLAGAAFGVYRYTRSADSLANRWETFGEAEMPEAQRDYIESKSANIGESVTDSGITITLDSVTCTDDGVYLALRLEPEAAEDYYFMPALQVTGSYGVIEGARVGVRPMEAQGGSWAEVVCKFDDLPEGARLNDGASTMRMEITEITLGDGYGAGPDAERIPGTWTFQFPLPESEPSREVASDMELDFDSGVTLHISGLSLDEESVRFSVETDNNEYIFAGSGIQAELARAAEPDAPFFTVEAKLEDGTVIPTAGGHMSWNEETGLDDWRIEWVAPLDPAEIAALVFSDGTTDIEVSME